MIVNSRCEIRFFSFIDSGELYKYVQRLVNVGAEPAPNLRCSLGGPGLADSSCVLKKSDLVRM